MNFGQPIKAKPTTNMRKKLGRSLIATNTPAKKNIGFKDGKLKEYKVNKFKHII